jgi:hypothetical protein
MQAVRARGIERLAAELYVAMEMDRVVRPARGREEALGRLCLHAREYYERAGGLPVRIILHRGDETQVIDPETAPPELLERAARLLGRAVRRVAGRRAEYSCRTTLDTLEHACSRCTVLRGRDYAVVAVTCGSRSVTRLGAGGWCTSGFGVEVHLWAP